MRFFNKKEKEAIPETIYEEIIKESFNPENSEKEIVAAISVALQMHLQEINTYENMILTIQKVMRPYSPWSSKIYGLRQYPRR
jgi:hypothetical protein